MANAINKLVQIQSELKAPKGQFNPFGKFNYRSAEDILEALKPIMSRLNVALILNDEIQEVGGRCYVKATACLYDGDTGEAIAMNCGMAREADTKKGMDDAQVTGACSSYARKYALNGMFAIDDTKDMDVPEYTASRKNPFNQQETSAKAVLKQKLEANGINPDWFAKWAKLNSYAELTEDRARTALSNFSDVVQWCRSTNERRNDSRR